MTQAASSAHYKIKRSTPGFTLQPSVNLQIALASYVASRGCTHLLPSRDSARRTSKERNLEQLRFERDSQKHGSFSQSQISCIDSAGRKLSRVKTNKKYFKLYYRLNKT